MNQIILFARSLVERERRRALGVSSKHDGVRNIAFLSLFNIATGFTLGGLIDVFYENKAARRKGYVHWDLNEPEHVQEWVRAANEQARNEAVQHRVRKTVRYSFSFRHGRLTIYKIYKGTIFNVNYRVHEFNPENLIQAAAAASCPNGPRAIIDMMGKVNQQLYIWADKIGQGALVSPQGITTLDWALINMLMFPILRTWKHTRPSWMNNPQDFTADVHKKILSSKDFKAAAIKLFGKNVTKAHTKALTNAYFDGRWSAIGYAYMLKGLVPFEWLAEIMDLTEVGGNYFDYRQIDFMFRNEEIEEGYTRSRARLRGLLENMSMARVRRLVLNDGNVPRERDVIDSALMMQNLTDDGIHLDVTAARSFHEIHEVAVREFNRVQQLAWLQEDKERHAALSADVNQDLYKDLDGVALPSGVELVTPKTGIDLINWGADMNHCIGSYARDAVTGNSLFFALVKDGKMVANAQINGHRVQQLYGRGNHSVPKELSDEFNVTLIEHGLITETGGWTSAMDWNEPADFDGDVF